MKTQGPRGPKFEDLTGRTFERLKVSHLHGFNPVRWECQCTCGGSKIVLSADLTTGVVRSCGCLIKESGKRVGESRRKRPFESVYNVLVHEARKRSLPLSISFEDFLEFTKITECHYCDSEIEWYPYMPQEVGGRYNLDRKDNSQGYSKENCVVCCARCNLSRANRFSYEEWLAIGKLIRTFLKTKGAAA